MEGQCREYRGPWYTQCKVWACVATIIILLVCCYVFLFDMLSPEIPVDELLDTEDYTYNTGPVPLYEQWLNFWLPGDRDE
uniref:P4 protein n=1 Tax=Citrus-associated rhabdovirus TaxID=2754374 RepID=A0A7D7QBN9_9RHAB|nr:P4 protein [Citrus-associated rhabdovirus]